jgi:hypothetical protein
MSKSRDNSGAIFRNKRKEKDTHPDRTGQCTIAGVEYWISGWMEEKDGEPYMSVKFKAKEDAKPKDGGREEIPF